MRLKSLHYGLLRRLIVGLLVVGLTPGLAMAQEDDQQDEDTAELEEIQVTGSRIKRKGFTTPNPVTILSAEQIEQSSAITLGDLLNELPQLRNTFNQQNSSRFIGTTGVGALDLRGLGTDRTLVLVNGRRHVSVDGTTTVDVNSIPTTMIERVEVVTGANSAVYGADATAGAVNFVLKDDFTGNRAIVSGGVSDEDGFNRYAGSLTMGRDFANGRGNGIISLTWAEQDLLTAGDRGGRFIRNDGFNANPEDGDTIADDGTQVDDGIPDDILFGEERFLVITRGGAFFGGPTGVTQIGPDGNPIPVPLGDLRLGETGLRCVSEFGDLEDERLCRQFGLQNADWVTMQNGVERFTADANFNFDVNENLTLYSETRFADVEARQQFQPSFDFFGSAIIRRDNAFVTDELGNLMDQMGVGAINLNRLNFDLGLRKETVERDTFRTVFGAKGDFEFLDHGGWSYDAFVNYGRTDISRLNKNNRIDERWFAALDAVRLSEEDVANIQDPSVFRDQDPQPGDIACRATLQAAQGQTPVLVNGDPAPRFAFENCVPANILGNGNISQAAANWINVDSLARQEVEQIQAEATVQNTGLIDTWAGPVSMVLGTGWREESLDTTEDSASSLGNTFFNALGETAGNFDVTSAFAEVSIPLLRDKPFAEDVTLEAAGRFDDFTTIGSTFTWQTRLQWTPIQQLSFRGSFGEALRAPNISDLFQPPSENFFAIDDPCDQTNLDEGPSRTRRIENCMALGIPDPENFDSTDEETPPGVSGGNPNLQEEDAETLTIGFVWSPRFIDGLDFSVDYWDIQITEAINNIGAQSILDRCVDDPQGIDNQFCALVERDPADNHNISLIRQFPVNLDQFDTSGIDFSMDYVFDFFDYGTMNWRTTGRYLDQRRFLLNSADDLDIDTGELGDPEWRVNTNLDWFYGPWEAFAQVRFMSEQFLVSPEVLKPTVVTEDPNPDTQSPLKNDKQAYIDLGVTYNFAFGLSAQFTVDNVTDNLPPFPFQQATGGGSAIFDNIGRFYNVEFTYDF